MHGQDPGAIGAENRRARQCLGFILGAAILVLPGLTAPASAQSPRVVTLWASGRIARFDSAAHLLVITQGTHEMTFTIRGETRLEQDRQPQPPAELAHDVGRDVRISYVTISGARIARRVVIVVVAR